MTAVELLQAGRLGEALTALQAEVRRDPADTRHRIFLFQLDCILGHLDKALSQLQVIAGLNAETLLLAQVFRPVIACELLRREVFAGRRSPLIFGEPMEWIGLLVQANALLAGGNHAAAAELRQRAFDAADASPGQLNGQPFEWIADADSRLGPLLEVILEGKYYWVPFGRIARVEIEKPVDLRDLVWIPARFTWTNGGAVTGHIPVRYPGSESSDDDALRLARRTDWREPHPGTFLGLGQRVLATDAAELPLLECRTLDLSTPAAPAAPAVGSPHG